MRQFVWKATGTFFLATILSAPAWGVTPARPGRLNYVEGQVRIGTQSLDAKSIGSTELQPGETLVTGSGKAEVLLTPGVFLRIGDNSSVKMISPSLTNTEVLLEKGRATAEVADIHKENNIRIDQSGGAIKLLKTGFYAFDADRNQVRVFNGKALVLAGDQRIEVKGGREINLATGTPLHAQKFNKKMYADELYQWSRLRSSYLAEANVDAARIYVSGGWYGPGWYWDPGFGAYTFLPGDGIFYSPFGWGFYSPLWAYRAPVVFTGRYYHRFDRDDYRAWGPAFHSRRDVVGGSFRGPRLGLRYPVAPVISRPHASVGFRGGFPGGSVRR
ncbi:MAG: FecR domain-containing protein [Acidobacteria bacterium]|nr:FecR domain-containing protein [Acidobacteriota bacterium]